MKLSTKIMIGLIMTGVVLIISFISLISYSGSNVNTVHRGVEKVSVETRSITLPEFESLSMSMITDAHYPVIFQSDYAVYFHSSDTVNTPTLIIPETFCNNITTELKGKHLNLEIKVEAGRYEGNDAPGITLITPSFPKSIATTFPSLVGMHYVGVVADSLKVINNTMSNGYPLTFFSNDTIGVLITEKVADLRLKESSILNLKYENDLDCKVSSFNGTTLDSVTFTGGGYTCDIDGIDLQKISVKPDQDNPIVLRQSFQYKAPNNIK